MNISQKVHFQVKTDVGDLEEVLRQFEAIKQDWVNHKDWLQCQLALAEGFTNAVRHAHKDKPSDTPIDIEISVTQKEINIRIWDYGQPFPLTSIPQKNPPSSDLAGGGRGIEILQKIADELSYDHHEDDRNCLLIKKILLP